MRAEFRNQLAVALVASVVFFTGLGASRLWDDDEPKNATCAREMMETRRLDCAHLQCPHSDRQAGAVVLADDRFVSNVWRE